VSPVGTAISIYTTDISKADKKCHLLNAISVEEGLRCCHIH
jgi:hypothetical protein